MGRGFEFASGEEPEMKVQVSEGNYICARRRSRIRIWISNGGTGQVVSGCWLAASVQLGASWCLALAVGRLSWPVIVGKQGSCYPLSSPES